MRAWEFLSEQRSPPIGLKRLNAIKRHQRKREASFARRRERVAIMYRDLDRDLRDLEVEKARLELEQLKADIAATRIGTVADAASAVAELEPSECEPHPEDPGGDNKKLGNLAIREVRSLQNEGGQAQQHVRCTRHSLTDIKHSLGLDEWRKNKKIIKEQLAEIVARHRKQLMTSKNNK